MTRKTQRTGPMLLAALCLTTLLATSAHAQRVMPTRDVDHPARNAFIAGAAIQLDGNTVTQGESEGFFEVPAGQRAVIEHASADCSGQGGNAVVRAFLRVSLAAHPGNVDTLEFQIPLQFQGSRSAGISREFYVGSITTRLYAERDAEGGGVSAGMERADTAGQSQCIIAISGYTVPL